MVAFARQLEAKNSRVPVKLRCALRLRKRNRTHKGITDFRAYISDPFSVMTSPVTQYQYDNRNRLKTVTGPAPGNNEGSPDHAAPVTIYDYDKAGQLISVTDPLNHITTYHYDDLGRQIRVTQPRPDGTTGQPVEQTLADPTTAPTGWTLHTDDGYGGSYYTVDGGNTNLAVWCVGPASSYNRDDGEANPSR